MTYSNSIGGEHATSIDGNGKNPDIQDLMKVAEKVGIPSSKAKKLAEEIHEIVKYELKDILDSYF